MGLTANERYATDPEFRERAKARARRAYNIEWHRLKRYGLSAEQFDAMLSQQVGLCAVCFEQLGPGRGTHVDHDHETGVVRGLLCQGCNWAIGQLKEDASRARALADYLDLHSSGGV